jgi:hypothetical protein
LLGVLGRAVWRTFVAVAFCTFTPPAVVASPAAAWEVFAVGDATTAGARNGFLQLAHVSRVPPPARVDRSTPQAGQLTVRSAGTNERVRG